MLKNLAKDSLAYSIPSFFSKGISILLIPLYTRFLSPSDYGIFDLFIAFMNIANLIVAFEISQGVARFYILEKKNEDKLEYASTAFWFSFLCYLLFTIFCMFFSENFSQLILGDRKYYRIFQTGVFYIFTNGMLQLVQNQFRWQLMSFSFMLNSVTQILLTSFFSIFFIYFMKFGIQGLFYGLLLGSLIPLIIGFIQLKDTFKFVFDYEKLFTLIKFTGPLVPSSLSVWFISYIDRVMIQKYNGINDVGIYGIGFRISSIVMILIVGFQTALTPLFFKHYKEKNTPIKIAFLFKFFIFFISLFSIFTVLFLPNILKILTTPEFYNSRNVIIYLIPSIIFSQLYIFFPGLSLTGKTHYILLINFLGGILNILLNFLIIPKYSYTGASIATMTSQFFVFLLFLFMSQKYYYVPHNWKKFISIITLISLIYIAISIFRPFFIEFISVRILILILSILIFLFGNYFTNQEISKIKTLFNSVKQKIFI